MSSQNNYALLGEKSITSRRWSRPLMVAGLFALFVSAGLVGYSFGNNSSQDDVDKDAIYAKLASSMTTGTNQTKLAVIAYSNQCYGFTGGTCFSRPCDEERHAQCLDGKCSCVGGCSGADGKCYHLAYKQIGSQISLRNKYWSSHWLYIQTVSMFSQLKVSSLPAWTFGGSQLFDFFELPGKINNKKQYFMTSDRWPTWVMSLRTTGSLLTGSVSLYGLYALNLVHTIAPWDPSGLTVQICSLKNIGYPTEIMIGSPGKSRAQTEWAYVHHGSWFVYGWVMSSDPGTGGYWTVSDPKMLEGLDDC